ncbi:caspase family protein [bacterium]|nr:caspase family protein [bacterium]
MLPLLLCPHRAQAQPQVWAIVVGIDEYVRPSNPKLRYAVADAKLFSQALQETIKVPKDHIFLMTSDAVDESSQPRFVNVAYRLSFLKGKVKKDDTVIFYFAGHGITLDGEPFLLTEEADNRSALTLKATSLHSGDLIATLQKNESGNVWVMLDACRNSPGDKEEAKLDRTVNLSLSQANVGLLQTATMFSCSVGERAWEWDEKKHGCYSYFLVEGLSREAADSQGAVTMHGLAKYVSDQVPAAARRFGSAQNPTMFYGGPTPDKWVLANVSAVARAPAGNKEADTSRHVAQMEALQARLDQETALRVAAEQRANLAESQRQELEQSLALLEKQVTGRPGGPGLSPAAQPSALAYSEGPVEGERSRALQSEVSRLREENEALKKRLGLLESNSAKLGLVSREVALESQPMLQRVWQNASSVQTQAEQELAPASDLHKSLQLCLSVRQALAQKVSVYQSCYRPILEARSLPLAVKKEVEMLAQHLAVQQLLNTAYELRLEAATSALNEASQRLKEALQREIKYQAIIADQQSQLQAAEAEIARLQGELTTAQQELSRKNLALRDFELREFKQKRGAFSRSPENRNYRSNLDQLRREHNLFLENQAESLPESSGPKP